MNPLLHALKSAGMTEPASTPASEPVAPNLPDPLQSKWISELRQHVEIPKDPTIGQLTSRSDTHAKALKTAGRTREAAALIALKEQFLRERDGAAWALIKARFSELDLSEKAYRALKHEDADPVKVLGKVWGKKGDALRGLGAARLRELLG